MYIHKNVCDYVCIYGACAVSMHTLALKMNAISALFIGICS